MSQTSPIPPSKGIERAVCAGIVLKLLLFFMLALNTRFVMDEFWQFGQAKYLWNGFYDTIWPVKSMGFALYYKLSHLIGWDAVSMLKTGRVMTAVLVLGTLWGIWRISRVMGHDRLAGLLILLAILCFSTFVERGFRLRSEPMALLCATLALWAAVTQPRAMIWAGIASGAAFLATQKSVYFNAALIVAVAGDTLWRENLLAALRDVAKIVTGMIAAILAYGVVLGGADAVAVVSILFTGPAELATQGGSYYEGLRRFVGQTLMRNWALYGLCVVGIGLALSRVRQLPRAERIVLVFTIVITALVFRHNQPWPYIFTMCIPFMALFVPRVWAMAHSHRLGRRLMLIAMGLIFGASLVRNLDYLQHTNWVQMSVIAQADAHLAPGETYFDGIGMLPNHRDHPRLWLDAPGLARLKADLAPFGDVFTTEPPKLIIQSYRTDGMQEIIAPFADEYGPVGRNILERGAPDARHPRAGLFIGIYSR